MNLQKILSDHKVYVESCGDKGIKANLLGADLRKADLRKANLLGADLRKADLRKANLLGADLRNADLYDADLRYADLRYADLRGANLRNADLPDSTFIITGEHYFISIENGLSLRAGCQSHSIEDWFNFSKKDIADMDGRAALKFHPRLLDIIDFYIPNHGHTRQEWLSK